MRRVATISRLHASLALLPAFVIAVTAHAASRSPTPPDGYCGPRCARWLLEYRGVQTPVRELGKEMKRPGLIYSTSLWHMERAIEKRGVEVNAVRFSTATRLRHRLPAIVPFRKRGDRQGHFVVVLNVDSNCVTFWEGMRGLRAVPLKRFDETHSQNALVFSQDSHIAGTEGHAEPLHRRASIRSVALLLAFFMLPFLGWLVSKFFWRSHGVATRQRG